MFAERYMFALTGYSLTCVLTNWPTNVINYPLTGSHLVFLELQQDKTVTSHEYVGHLNHRQLSHLYDTVSSLTPVDMSKLRIAASLWGNIPVTGGLPSQRAQQYGKCFCGDCLIMESTWQLWQVSPPKQSGHSNKQEKVLKSVSFSTHPRHPINSCNVWGVFCKCVLGVLPLQ